MTTGRKIALGLVALDTCALFFVFNAVAWMRAVIEPNQPILIPLLLPWVLLGSALFLIDGYRTRTDMRNVEYASTHTIALLAAMTATLITTFVVIPAGFPLQQSRAIVAFGFCALVPITIGYRRAIYRLYANARRERSIVFIGDPTSRESFGAEYTRIGMRQPLMFASGHTGTTTPPIPGHSAPAVPPFSEILHALHRGEVAVEAIVIRESNRDLSPETSQQLVDLYFSGVPTYTLELFHQVYWRKIPLYRLNQTWLFQEGFRVAREPVFERMKRASDIVLALIGLTLAFPVLVLCGIAIWFDDRGPVFFRQTRIGKHRAPFQLYKLRTMRSQPGGAAYTQAGDQRITRIGRFLRNSRLDELPQLINVFRGEMSLIGPRAEWDRLVADYEKQIPCYHFRHLVRPGITGWAQINYPYGANLDDTLRKLEYDLYYIRHFSFTLDASIVLKTIHVMLFGKGR